MASGVHLKPRSRYKGLILYDDDETHKIAIDLLKTNFIYKGILHDKDIDENGEIKKAHYHFVVRLDSAQTNDYLAKILGIKENYIQIVYSLKGALDYLTHSNQPDKYQYTKECLFGDLPMNLDNENKENDDFILLTNAINDGKCRTIRQLTSYAIEHDLLNTLRKNSYLFTQLLK